MFLLYKKFIYIEKLDYTPANFNEIKRGKIREGSQKKLTLL